MVDEKVRGALGVLNARLEESGIRLALVDPSKLKLLEKNARYMTNGQFKQLVENIKRDQFLSSVPFGVQKGSELLVLSGNHRVQAAAAAGLKEILFLYSFRPLGRDREVAIQISHNAIVGQDDPTLLKQLWEEIQNVSEKLYTGLDDKALALLDKSAGSALSPVRMDYKSIAFLFLPEEQERMEAVFADAISHACAAESVHVLPLSQFDRLVKALAHAQKKNNVKNSAVAMAMILDVYEEYMSNAAGQREQ